MPIKQCKSSVQYINCLLLLLSFIHFKFLQKCCVDCLEFSKPCENKCKEGYFRCVKDLCKSNEERKSMFNFNFIYVPKVNKMWYYELIWKISAQLKNIALKGAHPPKWWNTKREGESIEVLSSERSKRVRENKNERWTKTTHLSQPSTPKWRVVRHLKCNNFLIKFQMSSRCNFKFPDDAVNEKKMKVRM